MIALIFFILVILVVQFFIAKRESKWLGLILPISLFMTSLLEPFSDVRGYFILISVILFLIYLFFQAQRRKTTDLEKMNIKDL